MISKTRRLLYVTPFSLLPPIEGHRKRMAMTFNAIKQAGFELHVLFIPREYEWSELFDAKIYKDLLDIADLTFFCHASTPRPPAGDVYELDEWWPAQCDEYCRWLFSNNGYEMVFCNYIFMSRVFELVDRMTIKVLDTHDIFSDRKELLAAHGLKPEFFYTTREAEMTGIERADIVLAIKEQEAEYFREISDARVITLPYCQGGPTDPLEGPEARQPGKTRFGFFGSSNSINVKNINEFVAFLIRNEPAEGYEFELWLYGSLCKRLPDGPPNFVRYGGHVDRVDEFYESVDCVVNAQYFSTGLKIKVAEALAYHAPLICHRHSFEGFGKPVHPAQDCEDFEGVLEAMRAAARDPEFLHEIRAATITAQTRLRRECERQMAKVLAGTKIGVKWMYVFADPAAFESSRLYRHMVESFFTTFAGAYLIAVVASQEGAAEGPWSHFQRKANRAIQSLGAEELESGARRIYFDDPALFPEGNAASTGGFVLIDAVRLARGQCGGPWRDWLSEATKSHGLVRCEGLGEALDVALDTDGEGPLAVRYFRWLPWDMALGSGANNHELVPEVWVLGEEQVDARWYEVIERSFPALSVRLFRETCALGGADACAIAALMDAAFSRRKVPRLVIRLAADRGYDVFAEWCIANGVAFRSFIRYARPDALGRRRPALPARLSDLARPPEPLGDAPGGISSWGASGWEDLARAISKAPKSRAGATPQPAEPALAGR